MARKKRGDETLVNILVEDAKLAAGGSPAARRNRKKPSARSITNGLVAGANGKCKCGGDAVFSRQEPGWGGVLRYVRYCFECAGIAITEPEAPEPPPKPRRPSLRGVGVKAW